VSGALAIQTDALTRAFSSRVAVDRLSLRVRPGTVYGFLGPNGAGKTTTIRLLLGLLRPDSGSILIEGEALTPRARGALQRIGALVESPSVYPHLTGEENLEVTRRLRGLPSRCIAEALALVPLEDVRTCVRSWSTGMRQRLGLAIALVGRPSLLLLDEPANGLDPIGIRDLRQLLTRLAHESGVTILVSSHALADVEQVADDVGVIVRGRLRFQGPLRAIPGYGARTLEAAFLDLVGHDEAACS
jgi:lantibiotic transport system ATP-binding protein